MCLYGKFDAHIATCQVPVLIWIPTEYPIMAPYVCIDLESLQNSKIKASEYVDTNGTLYLPMLSSWDPETCNVFKLVHELSVVINEDPIIVSNLTNLEEQLPQLRLLETPLAIANTGSPALPPRPPKPPKETGPLHINSNTSNNDVPQIPSLPPRPHNGIAMDYAPTPSASVSPDIPPRPPLPTKPTEKHKSHEVPETPSGSHIETIASVFEQPDLIDSGTAPLEDPDYHQALQDLQRTLNELSSLDKNAATEAFRRREATIRNAIKQFESICEYESNTYDQLQKTAGENKQLVIEEIKKLDGEIKKGHKYLEQNMDVIDPNKLATTETVALNQLYELVAKDHAISDTIYALSKRMNRNIITLETFMKKIRDLARDQFLTREHTNKIILLLGPEKTEK